MIQSVAYNNEKPPIDFDILPACGAQSSTRDMLTSNRE